MYQPLLYEINTRCWLRELSDKCGRPVRLESVPASEFESWQDLGFTHIWLMGVWPSGPLARAKALAVSPPSIYSQALPDWKPEDVAGSPYAVADYVAAAGLGGELGLRIFRQKLREQGLKLVLDFVPNHLGLDHPWVQQRPELFVQGTGPAPETFPIETAVGTRWLAHGKDPYFPAWNDTAQLDYRLPATREAMTTLLLEVAARCDGVRCDMSMLLLDQVFSQTWQRFPCAGPRAEGEFWATAIREVRKAYPGFLLLAEAYWGLEEELQAAGFDFTYDKVLYDKLLGGDAAAVERHVVGMKPAVLERGVHFLENHDEPRVAALLPLAAHRAAALLVLGLPGMRFLHEGQLSGARVKTPVQMVRRSLEAAQPDVSEMYSELLTALSRSSAGRGRARLLVPGPSLNGCFLIQWQAQPSALDVVAVNLAGQERRGRIVPVLDPPRAAAWELTELIGSGGQQGGIRHLSELALDLELSAYGARLIHFEASATGLSAHSVVSA